MGAIVHKSGTNVTGVTFRVWAPNATNVVVRGQFNNWGDLSMTKDATTGYWTATNSAARPGQEYKYFLWWPGNTAGTWKQDPRAVWIRNGNSVIYDHGAFAWGTVTRPSILASQQVMYEMHIGSFYDPNPSDGRPGTFDDAILRLDYLQRLGVNVLAVMPVNEFGGDYSWGYNPEHIYAIESAYGGPDALKRFVKAAHQRGMKVQLDVVHNHYNPPPSDGLWDFDGNANVYFYTDGRSWTPWGSRPNYDQAEVRRYIQENIKVLLDEFRVDGFRWDSPQNILGYDTTQSGANPNTVLPNGKSMMMAINRMIHELYPECWSIAEDADLLTVRPDGEYYPPGSFWDLLRVDEATDSYDGHWQTSFHNTITPEIAKTNPAVSLIQGKVTEWSEPPGTRVIFTDNHDKSGVLNQGAARLANRMVPSDPTGKTARKKTLLNAALTLTAPGTPMLWMGQEFHATGSFSDSVRMGWREASAQHRIFRAHRDLIDLRETHPALQNPSLDESTGFVNDDLDVIAYWRLGASSEENLVVLFNFSAQDRTVQCPVPNTGTWHVQFNSDWAVYGSDFGSVGPVNNSVLANFLDGGSSVRANITVAAHSVLVLARSAPPAARLAEDLDSDGLADGWEALTGVSSPTDDADSDGLSNLREYQIGFDPNESDPTTVVGQFNGWSPSAAAMKPSGTPLQLHYLYVTEAAAPGLEIKFLSSGLWYGTSANPVFASVNEPGGNIAYEAPARGYAYFTFSPDTRAYTVETFTPANRVDIDRDDMDDRWEAWHGVTSASDDPDSDGFTNVQEFERGSHPTVWNRPQLALAGGFNGWNAATHPLTYFWHNKWHLDLPFRNGSSGLFKFTDGTWNNSWGETGLPDGVADSGGADISINFNQGSGVYRFQFNEASSAYQVTFDVTDANADGLQDAWLAFYGFSGPSATASADPDGDGITNLAELRRWSSPALVDRMSVVGSQSPLSWSPDDPTLRMNWSDARQRWEWMGNFAAGSLAFKFASGPGWGGANYGTGTGVPANTASTGGPSDLSTNLVAGRYRFAFSETNGGYTVQSFPVSAEWREVNGLPAVGAWTNDTDNDGMTDLLEFALGGNPTSHADGRTLQTLGTTNVAGTNRLVLQWLERTDGGNSLSIVPESASDLTGTWHGLPSANAANQANVPANHVRKETSTPQDDSRKFLRLRVTGP